MSTDILELQKEITQAEASQSRMEGARDTIKSTLLDEFECETIEEAEALLEKNKNQLATIRVKYATEFEIVQAKIKEVKDAE